MTPAKRHSEHLRDHFLAWEKAQRENGIDVDLYLAFQAGAEAAERHRKFYPPTLEEARDHHREKGYTFDVEQWHAHYQANGWKVGKVPMKSWTAAMITWERNQKSFRPLAAQAQSSWNIR